MEQSTAKSTGGSTTKQDFKVKRTNCSVKVDLGGKSEKFHLLKAFVWVICSYFFVKAALDQYRTYLEEPTGTSLQQEPMHDIPFPAITICDSNYEFRRAFYDLGFSRNPFGKEPKMTYSNPYYLFDLMSKAGETDVVPKIWEYYFTLEEVLKQASGESHHLGCRVGGALSCMPPRKMPVRPANDTEEVVEVEVEAGLWRSRILSDSTAGHIFLCHTLVPNTSVTFEVEHGNAVALAWNFNHSRVSPMRRVYVHDRSEHVLLNAFAIDIDGSVEIPKTDLDFPDAHKKRVQLKPTLARYPSPSDVHQCRNDKGYSENWCKIQKAWHGKVQELKDFYRGNLTCLAPGVWDYPGSKLSICQHMEAADSPDKVPGLKDILFPREDERPDAFQRHPSLRGLPLGVYETRSSSKCIHRCSKYTYDLTEETVTASVDNGLFFGMTYELYVYFPTPNVRTWREYRLSSGLDTFAAIGGSMGLVLGLSFLSVVTMAIDAAALLARGTSTAREVVRRRSRRQDSLDMQVEDGQLIE